MVELLNPTVQSTNPGCVVNRTTSSPEDAGCIITVWVKWWMYYLIIWCIIRLHQFVACGPTLLPQAFIKCLKRKVPLTKEKKKKISKTFSFLLSTNQRHTKQTNQSNNTINPFNQRFDCDFQFHNPNILHPINFP